ncbi:hypothetical protein Q8F55_007729 [Vanrija albida]|uniref:Uncharacterized protein n=1 Tax=Vanrija albida TaxID=181172 RepID=A0ABR3PUC9_9TREE
MRPTIARPGNLSLDDAEHQYGEEELFGPVDDGADATARLAGLELVLLTVLLALYMANTPAAPPTLPLAGVICALANLEYAAHHRHAVKSVASGWEAEQKAAEEDYFAWCDKLHSPAWHTLPRVQLPATNIDNWCDGYSPQPNAQDVESPALRLFDVVLTDEDRHHDMVDLNEDGVFVFVFGKTTKTTQMARFLSCLVLRMRHKCGKGGPRLKVDEGHLCRYLIGLVKSLGYRRTDDTVGLLDRATGLPLCFSGDRWHPLAPLVASHRRHGEPFSVHNLCTELRIVNYLRGSARCSSLFEALKGVEGWVRWLYESTQVGRQFYGGPASLPFQSLALEELLHEWGDNCLDPIEAVLLEPELVPAAARHECGDDCTDLDPCVRMRRDFARLVNAHKFLSKSRGPPPRAIDAVGQACSGQLEAFGRVQDELGPTIYREAQCASCGTNSTKRIFKDIDVNGKKLCLPCWSGRSEAPEPTTECTECATPIAHAVMGMCTRCYQQKRPARRLACFRCGEVTTARAWYREGPESAKAGSTRSAGSMPPGPSAGPWRSIRPGGCARSHRDQGDHLGLHLIRFQGR